MYLIRHPCVDCGEKDIAVLEFDHIHKYRKSNDVSKLITMRSPFKKVVSEISKCEVRCANCHRRKTALESQSWRIGI